MSPPLIMEKNWLLIKSQIIKMSPPLIMEKYWLLIIRDNPTAAVVRLLIVISARLFLHHFLNPLFSFHFQYKYRCWISLSLPQQKPISALSFFLSLPGSNGTESDTLARCLLATVHRACFCSYILGG